MINPRRTFRAALAVLCLSAVLAWAQALTIKDLIRLKRLGFSDTEVKAELLKAGPAPAVSAADLQALREAGAGEELLKALQAPTGPPLDAAEVVRLLKMGRTVDQILDAAIASGCRPLGTAAEAADLIRQGVPSAVLLALQGKPLGLNECRLLADEKAEAAVYLKLEKLVGLQAAGLTAAQALELGRAGVPDEIMAGLRKAAAPLVAKPAAGNLPAVPEEAADKLHPAELIGTWRGEMAGLIGIRDSAQMTFTEEGRYILNTGMGVVQKGRWEAEAGVLTLTAEPGMPEGDNYELKNGVLKITASTCVLTLRKIR
jgi:hypothetical protein